MNDIGIKPITLRYDLNDLARIEVVQGDTAYPQGWKEVTV